MKKLIFIFLSTLILVGSFLVILHKQKAPTVSVVLPTYNREKYLKRSIDALLSQTYQDFEIVVVNDASTDNTTKLLNEYQKKSDKIKVINHPENMGVSMARNTGNQYARGTYIAIMDSDDIAMPDFLEKSVDFMQKNPTVTVGVPMKSRFSDEDESADFHHPKTVFCPDYMFDFAYQNFFGNVGNIFKRDFILKHNITYDTKYSCGEDYDFWMQMIYKGATFAYIETDSALIAFKVKGGLTQETHRCYAAEHEIQKNFYDKIEYQHDSFKSTYCDILNYTFKKYPNLFLDRYKQEIAKRCPEPTDRFIKIKHPQWTDYLIFSTNVQTVTRKYTHDKATILSFYPKNKITIKWDKWGEETFVYDEKHDAYIFDENETQTIKEPLNSLKTTPDTSKTDNFKN